MWNLLLLRMLLTCLYYNYIAPRTIRLKIQLEKASSDLYFLLLKHGGLSPNYVRYLLGPGPSVRPSVRLSVCLSVDWRLSAVTFVRPAHRVKIFDNILHHLIAQGPGQIALKFWAKILSGTKRSCKLNTRGYEKLAFLRPIFGFISKTV